MKNGRSIATWLLLLAYMLLCFMPVVSMAESSIVTMPWEQLEREAREGRLLSLEPSGEGADAVVDGAVYGYGIKRFETWFEVGDASLWEAVCLTPPRGILIWDELMNMADAVEAYNRQSPASIWLLATQTERFPSTFSLMEQSDIREQWNDIQAVVCSDGQNQDPALLTERVLSIEFTGDKAYVTGIESGGTVYPLAAQEMRYAAIRQDADAGARSELLSSVKKATSAETGIIPSEMTYAQFMAYWNLGMPAPSEINFEAWKQAGEYGGRVEATREQG